MDQGFQDIKKKISGMTTQPGCYLMKDSQGDIFYIGKAKNLRNRLKSYFSGQDTRIFVQYLESMLADIEILVVRNDTEALILERELIKKHKPRFNIHLKDDKNYILLKLARPKKSGRKKDLFPKLQVVRKAKKDNARYFGPYPSAHRLRVTLELINKYFLLRTCPDHVLENRSRPCIQHQIGRCPAPCVYETPEYTQEVEDVILFLSGNYKEMEKRLKAKMWALSETQNYEGAAKVRDQIEAIKTSLASQVVSEVNQKRNQDIIGFSRMGPEVEIVRILIRGGTWHKSFNYNFSEQPMPSPEILRAFLHQAYKNSTDDIPHDILYEMDVTKDMQALKEVLQKECGRKVNFLAPSKGKLKKLVEIANKNAQTALAERIKQNDASERALIALQKRLGLAMIPERIECIDISLIQGAHPYGSCVVFINGQSQKKLYRSYQIKNVEGMNDFAMIKEVVDRRIKRGIKEGDLPDLLLIDGGKGQLSAAMAAAAQNNLLVEQDGFYIAGIAKARALKESKALNNDALQHSDERLFVPNESDPLILKAHTFERYLVERIRNEAHRFAITAHRKKRQKKTLQSELLQIPGIGKTRALKLLKTFGSVKKIKETSAQKIADAISVNLKKAEEILQFLK